MRKPHWEKVWSRRRPDEVSWYQPDPRISRSLIRRVSTPDASVLDVGGGASHLVDALLDEGYTDLAVLDIAPDSMAVSQRRLGERANAVEWLVGDVSSYEFDRSFDVWHDRALLHFLIDPESQNRYLDTLHRTLALGGHAVIATFGPDGPETCSGLPVRRYDPADMTKTLGDGFEAVDHVEEHHTTPRGAVQHFVYGLYQHLGCPSD